MSRKRLSHDEFEGVARAASLGGAAERLALVEQLEPLIQSSAKRAAAIASLRGFRSLELADLEQEARCLVLKMLPNWDAGKGDALVYFSFRVPKKILEIVKWTARHAPAGESIEADPALAHHVDGLTGEEGIELEELDEALRSAMEGMSKRHKYIMWRAYWLDEDDHAIAKTLGIPVASLRQQRYRALRRLKAALSNIPAR